MIVRVVHLTILPSKINAFVDLYTKSMAQIRSTPGCLDLSLLRDVSDPNRVTTLSKWKDLDALEAYRASNFFRSTWTSAKTMFADEAEAYSYTVISTTN
jgi:quinol monooxygenase YgiN